MTTQNKNLESLQCELERLKRNYKQLEVLTARMYQSLQDDDVPQTAERKTILHQVLYFGAKAKK